MLCVLLADESQLLRERAITLEVFKRDCFSGDSLLNMNKILAVMSHKFQTARDWLSVSTASNRGPQIACPPLVSDPHYQLSTAGLGPGKTIHHASMEYVSNFSLRSHFSLDLTTTTGKIVTERNLHILYIVA